MLDTDLLRIIKGIEQAKPLIGHDRWDLCWAEHEDQIPPFYRSDIVRENGELKHVSPDYEYKKFCSLRDEVLTYAQGPIWEFGCGNGHNSTKDWKGFDWSESAVNKLKSQGKDAEVFDMFRPKNMKIPGTAVTFHAMEQLGTNFQPFLDFLIKGQPKVVIHIEPIFELYDEDNLLDYLAIQYHKKRGYLRGYLPSVPNILRLKRAHFGSLFHEAYTVLIWKP